MQSLVENQAEFCAICGIASSVTGITMTEHHVVWRSRGGGDGPTIRICNRCHSRANGEKTGEPEWDARIETDKHGAEGVITTDRRTGRVIGARWALAGFDEGLTVAEFLNAPQAIIEKADQFRYLSDNGLLEVAGSLTRIEGAAWVARGELALVAAMRSPYGETVGILANLAKVSGVSLRTLYRHKDAIRDAAALGIAREDLPGYNPEAIRVIAAQADTERAIAIYTGLPEQALRGKPAALEKALAIEGMSEKPSEIRYHTTTCEACGASLPHRVKEKNDDTAVV